MHFDESTSLTTMEKAIIEEIQGKELWGDIAFSEAEYICLRERLKTIIHRNANVDVASVFAQFPCAVTTFFVFMALYKYNINFWGLAEKELDVKFNPMMHAEIGELIRKTFTRYNFDLSDVKDARWINIEPILFEAGLPPESGVDDLFYILKYDSHTVFDPQLLIEDLLGMRSYHIRKPMYRFFKRFQNDRAIEFMLEVYDSMLAVDQSHAGEPRYIGRYVEWKKNEKTKEQNNTRKRQEFQTRPYLAFENGIKGLCMVLPRIVLEKEWIDDVEWRITLDDDKQVVRRMNVFGEDGRRFVQSIEVPVSPAKKYTVSLVDRESLDGDMILNWENAGIKENEIIFFNANGRMISPSYLPMPYGVAILSGEAEIVDSKYVTTSVQGYPTDREGYRIFTVQPDGRDAELCYCSNGVTKTLKTKPQTYLNFKGTKLFSVKDEHYHLFTEIPMLDISLDEGVEPEGLNIRIGKDVLNIDDMFAGSVAEVDIANSFSGHIIKYGTYSVRLYQNDCFLRQAEFSYVPNIKSNYSPLIKWSDYSVHNDNKKIKFEKKENWHLEFENGVVKSDEESYIVELSPNICVLRGVLCSNDDENKFTCKFELPIRPLSIEVIDSDGLTLEMITDKAFKIGLADIEQMEYWLGFECFGAYKDYEYRMLLRSSNGIEQKEYIRLSHNGSCNVNLSRFYDTLRNCPLPAQLEICCRMDEDKFLPVLVVADTLELSIRPSLVRQTERDIISVAVEDGDKDLLIKKYGRDRFEITAFASQSILAKNGKKKGFILAERLQNGIYTVESITENSDFLFEEDEGIEITNGNNMLFVSSVDKNMQIYSFATWVEQLIRDILVTGVNRSITQGRAMSHLNRLSEYNEEEISEDVYEKLILLAEFVNAKCVEDKKVAICECMRRISCHVLNSKKRLELIRVLADMKCDKEIFDICLQEYNLLLFEVGSDDAVELANKLENKSAELALLLLMGVDAPVKDTIWKEKFRELIGKEAIKCLLSVPNEEDIEVIKSEQKKFFREESPCAVRINLTTEISGDMRPIQEMIEVTHKSIRFNISKKPDVGVYFTHIRYVDQYVNWHNLTHDKELNMNPNIKQMMLKVVQENCKDIVNYVKEIGMSSGIGKIMKKYSEVLISRTTSDIFSNMLSNDNGRYFYLQGIAAFFAVLPKEYRKYGWAVRTGEKFMNYAMIIAPRISKRDLIMASTYIYLMRKEEKLCR